MNGTDQSNQATKHLRPLWRRRPKALLLTAVAMSSIAGLAWASIPGPEGIIKGCMDTRTGSLRVVDSGTSCRTGERVLPWNQAGVPGPAGPAGTPGLPSAAFFTQTFTPVNLQSNGFSSVQHLDVPAGSYAVTAMVVVSNNGPDIEPLLCALTSSQGTVLIGTSVTAAQQIETSPGVSTATIPLSFATTLTSDGRIDLECFINDGPGATPQVVAQSMSMTAVSVANVIVQ